jgi:hypothetical protein
MATLVALAAVFVALAAGVSRRRLWPVAGFLALAVGTLGYNWVSRRARKRLSHRLRHSPLPAGVRLRKPLWLRVDEAAAVLDLVAIIGAIVAAIGFPQAGIGILLVLGGFLAAGYTMFRGPDLTIEKAGLRFHFGAAHFLVPWPSIRVVEMIGPDHNQIVRLGIADLERIRNSVSPDTPRSRKRMRNIGGISRDEIMLMPWTAGVDGQTLERVIREGQAGTADLPN